nr:immunoglobulin light chain junction region [Macaca mulatta]MOW12181.1 immunoglobulin light chain junction region [Macaca mulatta]MOW12242.1 immunoglobulin light chain junction region [Macaca mulatta]
CMQALQLPFSF